MAEQRPRDLYDVVIIGGGPAGLAAAVYTARQGLTTAVVAVELGGQAQWAGQIDNYLGLAAISGGELARHFRDHVDRFDVDTFPGQHADALMPSDGGFEVHSREGLSLNGRAAIIATGRAPSRLAVPGEKELVGRGISYCATCDAAFFRGQRVAVVGPGESAAEAALQLAALDAEVTVVCDQKQLRASPTLMDRLAAAPRVELRMESQVTSIEGEERVTGVTAAGRLRARSDASGERSLHRDGLDPGRGAHRRSRAGERVGRDRGRSQPHDDDAPACSPPATSRTSSASRSSSPPAMGREPGSPSPSGCSGSSLTRRPTFAPAPERRSQLNLRPVPSTSQPRLGDSIGCL